MYPERHISGLTVSAIASVLTFNICLFLIRKSIMSPGSVAEQRKKPKLRLPRNLMWRVLKSSSAKTQTYWTLGSLLPCSPSLFLAGLMTQKISVFSILVLSWRPGMIFCSFGLPGWCSWVKGYLENYHSSKCIGFASLSHELLDQFLDYCLFIKCVLF